MLQLLCYNDMYYATCTMLQNNSAKCFKCSKDGDNYFCYKMVMNWLEFLFLFYNKWQVND